ncbi:MAG: PKD domain-containing protein, partial [Chitinophagaceae bacterium]|nr:PKD domain-containing protein [Chitinophagaceae bacterium]
SGGTWSGSPFVTANGIFNPAASGNGVFNLTYSLTASGCSGASNMRITVQNPPNANAGTDTTLCADGSIYRLSGSPSGGVWSGSPLVTASGNFTASSPGIYTLVYSRGSGLCIGTDTVRVTVVSGVSNNVIGSSQGICSGVSPLIITGSNATAGGLTVLYQWQESNDSLSWTDIPNAINKDFLPPAPAGQKFYRRLASSGVCSAGVPSNGVRIYLLPDAEAELRPVNTIACAPYVITSSVLGLVTYPDRNLTYRWYANDLLLGSGETFPGYTIANPDDSVIIKMVAVSLYGCKNDSVSVKFKTNPAPVPSFTLSMNEGCGPLNIDIINTTPQASRFTFFWDFGTGQTFSGVQPGSVFFPVNPNRGDTVYVVSLKATAGCDSLPVTQTVRVRSRPRTIFTPDKSIGCSPMTVVFNNNSAGSNATFEWDFGDGSPRVPGGLNSVSHTFNTGVLDTFLVRLFSRNDCGTDTAFFDIVVNPNLIRLDFGVSGSELNGCTPHTVRFVNNTIGANLFRWDFGDGSPVITTTKGFDTLFHTFSDTGRYVVTLFASNGCSDTTSTEVIFVAQSPDVSFTANPQVVCLGDTIRFTNTSSTGLAFNWDFGDGTASSVPQPFKVYEDAGTYRVVLKGTVQYPQGLACTDSAVATIIVNAPGGFLNYRGGFYCSGNSIGFEVFNTNATRFVYYFGNGDSIISSSAQVSYSYTQPGTYVPYVRITYQGCSRILSTGDTIRIEKLKAGYRFNTVQLCGNTNLAFTDTSSSIFGINEWAWRFGDGTTSAAVNPQKNFTQSGLYPVTLRIAGNGGCTDSVSLPIDVFVQPFPSIEILGDTFACIGLPNRFVANNSGNIASVLNWQIGGGQPATGPEITQTWTQAGSYNLRLIGISAFGCADTAFMSVRVNPSPVVSAGPDERICLGNSIRLNVRSSAPLNWSPVAGLSCIDCPNPVASPTTTTQYIVYGTNTFGCTLRDTIMVYVEQPFNISVSPNDTLCASNGERAQLFASNAFRYQWNPSIGLNAANIPNPVASPASTTTYRVIGLDEFNCFSDTAFVTVAVGYNPTVSIPSGTQVIAGTQVQLNPSYTGGPFKQYTWTPDRDLSCNNCPSPVATINNNIRYRLVAENIYGCTASDTVTYTVICSPDQVYIPNAFSPDGDGINDVLMVRGKGIATVKSFRIFNRFGQVVFEKQNFEANDPSSGWDGRINGVPASGDVYVFTAEVLCTAGANYTYKGNVTLFR